MTRHTIAARVAAAMVAAVAGAASWEHIASVAIRAGERQWVGYSLPLAIDGLVVVGVSAVLEDRHHGRIPRRSARLAVAVGVAMTLAANIASAAPSWTARAVAVAAPASFLVAVEVLTRTGASRHGDNSVPSENPLRATQGVGTTDTPAGIGHNGHRRRGDAAEAVREAMTHHPDASVTELAAMAGVSRSTVRRVAGS